MLTSDLRQAVRNLLRTPGFTLVAVLTLALGIGANAAIFSVVNGVVLRPLAYPDPDRLVFITSQFPTLGFDQFWVSPPEYLELSERQKSFDTIGAYTTGQDNVAASDRPRRVVAAAVTSTPVRRARREAGARPRDSSRGDMLTGSAPVVVLTHELWMSAFGGDQSLVGQDDRSRRGATDGRRDHAARLRHRRRSRRAVRAVDARRQRAAATRQPFPVPRRTAQARLDAADGERGARDAAGTVAADDPAGPRAQPEDASPALRRLSGADRRRRPPRGMGAAGGGRLRAAHRLRQSRQPAARARGGPPARVRHAPRARRHARPAASPVHDRRPGAVGQRRHARPGVWRRSAYRRCSRCSAIRCRARRTSRSTFRSCCSRSASRSSPGWRSASRRCSISASAASRRRCATA